MGQKTAYVLRERRKSKIFALILIIGGSASGIAGWIYWKWYALPIALFVCFMLGNFYSYIMIQKIRKKTGLDDGEINRLLRHPPY